MQKINKEQETVCVVEAVPDKKTKIIKKTAIINLLLQYTVYISNSVFSTMI